jgi:hypothetical protein
VLLIRVIVIPASSTGVLYSGCNRQLVAKRGKTGLETAAEFCLSLRLSYLKGILTCRKILRYGANSFTSPKKVVLPIFIALKNPSISAGIEPANLRSKGKHDNHYTIENDYGVLMKNLLENVHVIDRKTYNRETLRWLLWRWAVKTDVDESCSELCPVTFYGNNGVGSSVSDTTVLVTTLQELTLSRQLNTLKSCENGVAI